MKAGDIIEAIERVFLDIIGQIVPGFFLLVGLSLVWPEPLKSLRENPTVSALWVGQTNWVLVIAVAYVVGHAVTSIGDTLVFPAIERAVRLITRIHLGFSIPRSIMLPGDLFKKVQSDPIFQAFKADVVKVYPTVSITSINNMAVGSLRNFAMSIAPEQRNTIYRFMFISLLNLGVATVLLLIAALWLIIAWLQAINAIPGRSEIFWPLWALLVIASLPFIERRYAFFRRAIEVPFSMALVTLGEKQKARKDAKIAQLSSTAITGPLVVYLAGGFQTGWQDKLKEAASQFRYFDPRSHQLRDKGEYAMWDLEAIRRSDWIFAYLEAGNPGGYALAAEIGY